MKHNHSYVKIIYVVSIIIVMFSGCTMTVIRDTGRIHDDVYKIKIGYSNANKEDFYKKLSAWVTENGYKTFKVLKEERSFDTDFNLDGGKTRNRNYEFQIMCFKEFQDTVSYIEKYLKQEKKFHGIMSNEDVLKYNRERKEKLINYKIGITTLNQFLEDKWSANVILSGGIGIINLSGDKENFEVVLGFTNQFLDKPMFLDSAVKGDLCEEAIVSIKSGSKSNFNMNYYITQLSQAGMPKINSWLLKFDKEILSSIKEIR
jgi:hypothetical protein